MVIALAPIPVVALILVVSSSSEARNELNFPLVQPVVGDLVEHSFIEGGGSDTSSEEVNMALKPRAVV